VRDRVLSAKPETIGGLAVTGLDTTDGFKFLMGENGWVLIRLSGTEPIVRVYTETTHGDKVQAILQDGLKIAGLK
jgi:phosphomannomutase